MPTLLLNLLGSILPGVLNRVLPPEKMTEADAAKLQLELTKELLGQDWQQIEADYKDRDSARQLAAQDIAKGNAFTTALAAIVRPAWGLGSLALVAHAVLMHVPIDVAVKDIVELVLQFYFGGRVIEKIAPAVVAAWQGKK